MADEFKKMLVKIGLSASEYTTLIRQIKKDTQDVQDQTRQTAKEAMDASKAAIAATKEQIVQEQLLQQQAKTMAALDQAKLAWQRQLAAGEATRSATARAETAEIQKQIALLRQKAAEAKTAAKASSEGGEGGGGLLGGVMEGLKGLMGGGVLGAAFSGALAGGGLFMLVSKATEAVGELVKKMAEIPFEAGEIAEKFENMAARTGTSVEELEKLRLTGASVGLGMEQMSTLLTRMAFQFTKNLGDGASKAEKTLHRFGVEVRDVHTGAVRPLTEILADLAGVFEKLPDGWTKNRIMIEAFGRQGAQLIPVLNQGKEKMHELYGEASQLSIVFSKELIEAQHRYNVEAEKWNMEWEQFKVTMGEGILPILAEAFGWINKIVQAMNIDADVPREFANDIGNWATSQAALKQGKGKYARMALSEKGQAHMKEMIPESVMKQQDMFNPQTWQDWYAHVRDSGGDTSKVIKAFGEQFPDAIEKAKSSLGKIDPRLTDLEAKMKKLDAATQKFLETQAKANEESEQAGISQVKDEVADKYKQGQLSYADYAAKTARLDQSMYDSRVNYIEKWATDEKKRLTDSEKDKAVLAVREKTLEIEKNQKLGKAWEQFQHDKHKLTLQGEQDDIAAQMATVKSNEALAKASLANITKLTEDAFKERQITADQYIQLRQEQFRAELDDEIEGIKGKYSLEADNAKRSALVAADVAKAEMAYNAKVTEFAEQQASIRDKFAKQGFDNVKQELQGVLSITNAQGAGNSVFGGTSVAQLQQLRDVSVDYLRNRMAALSLEDAGTEAWHKTKMEVIDAVKDVQQYNQELMTAKDILVPISAAFAAISKDLGQFGGNTAKELTNAFKLGASSMQQFSKLHDVMNKGSKQDPIQQLKSNLQDLFAKVKSTSDSAGQRFSDLTSKTSDATSRLSNFADVLTAGNQKVVDSVDTLVAAFDQLTGRFTGKAQGGDFTTGDLAGLAGPAGGPDANSAFGSSVEGSQNSITEATQAQADATNDSASKLSDFSEKLQAGVGAVTGLIAAFSNAQGALGGAVGGGSAVFGAVSSMTSNPYAMAAGAIGGAVLGGILGSKRASAKKMADDFKKQTSDIMSNVQDGTTKLKDGLADLAKERQDAISSLGNSKKGKKELQGVLDQIDAATKQLMQQQQKLMKDLTSQLQILSAPTEYQQWLGNIQSILDKYQQFADAAMTTQELAQAQKFLNLSLQQYSDTLTQDVVSAQQDAITNAIQLMDLQQQAADLMAQEAQQEWTILTQGNVTRQQTSAQSKGAQIEASRKNRDEQLDVINQQIALAQFKYSQEKQIFNLATTRIGLEAELLGLQKDQTVRDISRINALQALVSALAGGNISSLSQLLQTLGINSGGNLGDQLLDVAQRRGGAGGNAGLVFKLL
jgi:hypothetical protein